MGVKYGVKSTGFNWLRMGPNCWFLWRC